MLLGELKPLQTVSQALWLKLNNKNTKVCSSISSASKSFEAETMPELKDFFLGFLQINFFL